MEGRIYTYIFIYIYIYIIYISSIRYSSSKVTLTMSLQCPYKNSIQDSCEQNVKTGILAVRE